MTPRDFDARLRKIEQKLGNNDLSRLSDEELDEEIRIQLGHILQPFGMDICVARDAFAASADHEQRRLAEQLDKLIPILPELYPSLASERE